MEQTLITSASVTVREYGLYCTQQDEAGHRIIALGLHLNTGVQPLLDGWLCLGEAKEAMKNLMLNLF